MSESVTLKRDVSYANPRHCHRTTHVFYEQNNKHSEESFVMTPLKVNLIRLNIIINFNKIDQTILKILNIK